ncbi:MAG: NADH-quinone oxidoreductase subunit A [Pseudomonadota bacterium]|jgi:NADH-quinone oxidoreductase subunit A|nr:NADH-quinone oxidoreductase subunit A [Alphaproteobacteria bacterium]
MIREEYFSIIVFFCVVFFMTALFLSVAWLRGKRRPYYQKNAPYECGFDSFETFSQNARRQFDVQFYLTAILFIIFDLEIVFLFPWAIALEYIGWSGFWSMVIFLAVLTIGFVYEWKKGAFDW